MTKYMAVSLWAFVTCTSTAVLANSQETDYLQMQAQEAELAGDIPYDLSYGAAALGAGEPGEAVFAFQRVLAQEPSNGEAHLGIARAYFDLGEDNSSRRHFNMLYAVADPRTRTFIKTYLDALDDRAGLRRATTVGYLGLDIGYDDNITQIRDGQPAGILGVFDIQSSKFSDLSFAVNHQQPISAIWHWQAGAHGDLEIYHDFDDFDKRRLNLNGGVGGRLNAWRWNFDLALGEIRRDSDKLYSSTSLSAVLEHREDRFWKKAGIRMLQRDYDLDFQDRDIDGYELLLGARHAGKTVLWTDVGADLFIGDESTKNEPSNEFGRDHVTLRLRWYLLPRSKVRVVAGYDYSKSKFKNTGVAREDDFRALLVQVAVANVWQEGIDLNAEISRDENHSNISTLNYDRNRISVGLRYNWGI